MSGGTIREISTSDTEIVAASVTPADGNVVRYQWVDRVHGSGIPHQDIAGATGEGVPEMRARGKRQQTSYDLKRLAYRQIINYELTADAASFSLTGQDESLTRAIPLTADAATFSLSDQPIGYARGAPAGAFTFSGQPATFQTTRVLSAAAATFNLSAISQALTAPANYTLNADVASFNLSGQAATPKKTAILTAGAASFALSGQTASLVPTVSSALQPVKNALGWNFSPPAYFQPDFIFTDCIAYSRNWRCIDGGGNEIGEPPQDALGWPTSIPVGTSYIQTVMMRSTNDVEDYPSGTYLAKVSGCTVTWGGDATDTGLTVGVWKRISVTPTSGGISMNITAITGTVRVVLCLPYIYDESIDPETVTRFTFNPAFLEKHANTPCLRSMDWFLTNNQDYETFPGYSANQTYVQWATPVNYCRYVSDDYDFLNNVANGRTNLKWPIEVFAELCNQLNAIPHINVPHKFIRYNGDTSNDASIVDMARALDAQLNSNLRVHVEYTNEIWNPKFVQDDYVVQMSAYLGIGYHECFADGARRCGKLFKSVLGDERVTSLMSIQSVEGVATATVGMAYLAATYPGDTVIDALVMAPYPGYVALDLNNPANAVAYAHDFIDGGIPRIDEVDRGQFPRLEIIIQQLCVVCNDYDLRLYAYEGGEGSYADDQIGPALQADFVEANKEWQRSVEVGQMCYDLLDTVWRENGGELFMYYLYAERVTRSGGWCAIESTYQTRASRPKFDKILQWQEDNPVYWDGRASAVLCRATYSFITNDGFRPTVNSSQRLGTMYSIVVPDGDFDALTDDQRNTKIIAGQQSSGAAALWVNTPFTPRTGINTLEQVTGLSASTNYDIWTTQDNGLGFISEPIKADATTYPLGNGVVLLIANDNATGSTFVDESPYPKTASYPAGTVSYAEGGPSGMTTSGRFQATEIIAYASNADFGFGTDDFMVDWWQYTFSGGTTFREIWDFRTASSDVQLSCHTNGTPAVCIRRANTGDILTSSLPYTADTWEYYQLVRSGGFLSLYRKSGAGSIALVAGPLADSTNYARATFQFGKDVAGAGAFKDYACSIRIQKTTVTDVGVEPTLPISSTMSVYTDTFVDADTTDLTAHVPTPDGARSAPWIAGQGTCRIDTNRAYFSTFAVADFYYRNVGSPNAQIKLLLDSPTFDWRTLCLRWNGTSGVVVLVHDGTGAANGQILTADTGGLIGSALTGLSFAPGDTVSASIDATNTIRIKINDVLVQTPGTSSSGATNTFFGIRNDVNGATPKFSTVTITVGIT